MVDVYTYIMIMRLGKGRRDEPVPNGNREMNYCNELHEFHVLKKSDW